MGFSELEDHAVQAAMGNELLDEFEISQLWQRASDRGAAPGLKIIEVGGEGAERIRAHSVISERLEGGHIGIGQDFGIAIG